MLLLLTSLKNSAFPKVTHLALRGRDKRQRRKREGKKNKNKRHVHIQVKYDITKEVGGNLCGKNHQSQVFGGETGEIPPLKKVGLPLRPESFV